MTRSEQLVSAVLQAQFPHLNSLIHLFVGGSELHGAKLKDTDDLDIYGVYLEPPELVLGLDKQDFYLWSTAGNERRNTADDIDVCLYSLRKWAGLAAKGEDRVFKRRSSPRCRSLRDFAILEAAMSGNPEGMGVPEPNHPQTVLAGKHLRRPHQTCCGESRCRNKYRLAHIPPHVPHLVGFDRSTHRDAA
jgi:hypothetical protein